MALVVGNEAYAHLPALPKAANDAQAIAETLVRLGFEVTLRKNLDRRSFTDALGQFKGELRSDDEVIFHFSGHGLAIGNRNHLLPTDLPEIRSAGGISSKADDVEHTIEILLERQPRYVFAIVDACREIPTAARRNRKAFAGTCRLSGSTPRNVFVLISAGPGENALDQLGAHDGTPTTVFTRVLLNHLQSPKLSIQAIARNTMTDVRDLASSVGHEQFPAYADRLGDEPVLAGVSLAPVAAVQPEPPPAASSDLRLTGAAGTSLALGLPAPPAGTVRLIVEGLPPKARLSAGDELAPGRWSVPATEVRELRLETPPNGFGAYELAVSAASAEGNARRTVTIWLVLSAPSMAEAAAAVPPPDDGLQLKLPEPMSLTIRELGDLLARGVKLFGHGDVTSARLLFKRAVDAGEPMGLLLFGMTYDPLEYHRKVLAGLHPNPRLAMEYYRLARDAGIPEAAERISRLEAHVAAQ